MRTPPTTSEGSGSKRRGRPAARVPYSRLARLARRDASGAMRNALGLTLLFAALFVAPSARAGAPVQSPSAQRDVPRHRGPAAPEGEAGPRRFVPRLLGGFRTKSALEELAFADRYYRAPANEGYDAVLDRLHARLVEAGFGSDPRLALAWLDGGTQQAWTPVRARLEMISKAGERTRLHGFESEEEPDRVMLPIHAPSGSASGRPVFALEDVTEGSVWVSEEPLGGRALRAAAERGAVAALSASLAEFNRDPDGGEEYQGAIQFRSVPQGTTLPVAQISPRTFERLRRAAKRDPDLVVALEAEVRTAERPLRVLVATIRGARFPEQAVAVVSHVQEPGAGDNASGVAGTLEGVLALTRLLRSGSLSWPARSLVFVWGDEIEQSRLWLEETEFDVVAGLSADMLGQSRLRTGAICLLERSKDPGALVPLPPDRHTPWGAGRVRRGDLHPDALAVVARAALHDVAAEVGGWETAEHPWEGGSDHDVFLRRGVPAVLFWHFTDFTYHTGLDRLDRIDPEELRRSSVAVLATALAIADPRSPDLARYRQGVELERALRVEAAREAGRLETAQDWEEWCDGALAWIDGRLAVPRGDGAEREDTEESDR